MTPLSLAPSLPPCSHAVRDRRLASLHPLPRRRAWRPVGALGLQEWGWGRLHGWTHAGHVVNIRGQLWEGERELWRDAVSAEAGANVAAAVREEPLDPRHPARLGQTHHSPPAVHLSWSASLVVIAVYRITLPELIMNIIPHTGRQRAAAVGAPAGRRRRRRRRHGGLCGPRLCG
mgnify:CR=1 FL=1